MLQFAEEGTARRKYYEARMKKDPSSLFPSAQAMIEHMLSEPKVLMWTVDWTSAGDERLKGTSISNVHIFVAILNTSPLSVACNWKLGHKIAIFHLVIPPQSGHEMWMVPKLLSILDSVPTPAAWAYPRGSELRRLFDFHLLKMKQSGVVDKVEFSSVIFSFRIFFTASLSLRF